jgi:hypothetical protein
MPEVQFSPAKLGNEELFTTQMEIMRRRYIAERLGRGQIVEQLDMMLQMIETERRDRMYMERMALLPTSPVVVETDPALQRAPEPDALVTTPPRRNVRRPVRSDRPQST